MIRSTAGGSVCPGAAIEARCRGGRRAVQLIAQRVPGDEKARWKRCVATYVGEHLPRQLFVQYLEIVQAGWTTAQTKGDETILAALDFPGGPNGCALAPTPVAGPCKLACATHVGDHDHFLHGQVDDLWLARQLARGPARPKGVAFNQTACGAYAAGNSSASA